MRMNRPIFKPNSAPISQGTSVQPHGSHAALVPVALTGCRAPPVMTMSQADRQLLEDEVGKVRGGDRGEHKGTRVFAQTHQGWHQQRKLLPTQLGVAPQLPWASVPNPGQEA